MSPGPPSRLFLVTPHPSPSSFLPSLLAPTVVSAHDGPIAHAARPDPPRLLDIVHADQKLYLVFEFLDVDLKRYMENANKAGRPITPDITKVRTLVFPAPNLPRPARIFSAFLRVYDACLLRLSRRNASAGLSLHVRSVYHTYHVIVLLRIPRVSGEGSRHALMADAGTDGSSRNSRTSSRPASSTATRTASSTVTSSRKIF